MKLLVIIGLLTIAISAFAQRGGLKGRVSDNDQVPFGGLKIEVLDRDSVITLGFTDQNGDYLIDNVKPGQYNLRIQHLGFRERIIKDVLISSNETKQFDIVYPRPCIESLKICPSGQHTDNIIPIVYGLPGKKLMKKSEKELIRLGGCIVTGCDPKWYCKQHTIEF